MSSIPERRFVFVTFACLMAYCAHAWETDQLSRRSQPLADATVVANARLNALLDEAAATANERLMCHADVTRSNNVLVDEIAARVARRDAPSSRDWLKRLGYGEYSAWLESTPEIARFGFYEDRSDIFGGIPWTRAPILSMAGTCSTISLAGVRTGTDKADHFLNTGYRYFNKARGGRLDKAVRWGTWTENTWLGWYTSTAFSYGDLYANWQGYRFYASLFDPQQGLFTLDDNGCIRRVHDFDWAKWVDWRWDELMYPTTYRPKVLDWLTPKLASERDALCADVDAWGPEVVAAQAAAAAEGDTPWLGERTRPRVDPFGLAGLCGTAGP